MLGGPMGLAHIVRLVFWLYSLLVLVRCVLSFLRTPSYTSRWLPFWNFVYATTEPVLSPIRRALSRFTRGLPLDFSPLVLILLLSVVERVIIMLILRAR